jgi:hypothetical protein
MGNAITPKGRRMELPSGIAGFSWRQSVRHLKQKSG